MGFFDDLTSSFQESVNKTQKESKYKKTISDNKKKIEETYYEIGKMVYQKKNMDEELISYINIKVEDIDRMLKENTELNKEILVLNNKKICPNCGKEVELNTTFCPNCGAEQEKISVELFVPKGKRKCSGCGAVIDDKNVFCPKCGAKKEEVTISEVKAEPVVENTVEEQPIQEPIVESKVEEQSIQEPVVDNIIEEQAAQEPAVENKEEILNQPVSKEIEIDFNFEPKVEEIETKENIMPRRCQNCGEILEENDVFCANCGTKNEQ